MCTSSNFSNPWQIYFISSLHVTYTVFFSTINFAFGCCSIYSLYIPVCSSATQGRRQNFSRGGLQASSGEGSPPFFKFQRRLDLNFCSLQWLKLKNVGGRGGHGPLLLMAAYAYGAFNTRLISAAFTC